MQAKSVEQRCQRGRLAENQSLAKIVFWQTINGYVDGIYGKRPIVVLLSSNAPSPSALSFLLFVFLLSEQK
jgi:hypothetical protein